MLGGLLVGVVTYRYLPGRRPHNVPDVIEANALRGGRMSPRVGLVAAVFVKASGYESELTRKQEKISLMGSLKETLRCRAFLILCVVTILFLLVSGFIVCHFL